VPFTFHESKKFKSAKGQIIVIPHFSHRKFHSLIFSFFILPPSLDLVLLETKFVVAPNSAEAYDEQEQEEHCPGPATSCPGRQCSGQRPSQVTRPRKAKGRPIEAAFLFRLVKVSGNEPFVI